jgi:hypothetical protein
MTTIRVWVALDEALKKTYSTAPNVIIRDKIIWAVNLKIGVGTKFHHTLQDSKKQPLKETQRRPKNFGPAQ